MHPSDENQDEDQLQGMAGVAESCVYCRCGCCKDGCPVYEEVLEESMSPKGRNEMIRAIMKGVVDPDDRAVRIAYSCLLCRRDEYSCGAKLKNAEATEQLREFLNAQGAELLPEHDILVKNLQNYGNPWGEPRNSRRRWARDSTVDGSGNGITVDLLFVGCTYSLDRALHETPKALASVMTKAGVAFRALLDEEVCCGSTIKRLGQKDLFAQVRDENAAVLLGAEPEHIVTPCAGCYKTLLQDYGQLLAGIEILHSTQYILRLIKKGEIVFREVDAIVTYHDPCHLGRHADVFDEPREILGSIPGLRLTEMKDSRELSRCCGGGGGVKTAYPGVSHRIAVKRIRQAEKTGASLLVTACPFCVQSLSSAAKDVESPLRVVDLSVLVDEACRGVGDAD